MQQEPKAEELKPWFWARVRAWTLNGAAFGLLLSPPSRTLRTDETIIAALMMSAACGAIAACAAWLRSWLSSRPPTHIRLPRRWWLFGLAASIALALKIAHTPLYLLGALWGYSMLFGPPREGHTDEPREAREPAVRRLNMKVDGGLALICGTVILLAVLAAIQFRYETHNKGGWGTARFDRWTGKVEICHEQGCYSEEELRNAAEQAQAEQVVAESNVESPHQAPLALNDIDPTSRYQIESPIGAKILFPRGTERSVIESTIRRVDACGRAARSQLALDACYRPSIASQLDGTAYELTQSPIYDPTQKQE